jgi:hypothetical protein
VTRLFDTLFGVADFPEGFRLGVRARGIAARPGRTPRSARDRERDEETLESLRGALTAAGLRAGSSAS